MIGRPTPAASTLPRASIFSARVSSVADCAAEAPEAFVRVAGAAIQWPLRPTTTTRSRRPRPSSCWSTTSSSRDRLAAPVRSKARCTSTRSGPSWTTTRPAPGPDGAGDVLGYITLQVFPLAVAEPLEGGLLRQPGGARHGRAAAGRRQLSTIWAYLEGRPETRVAAVVEIGDDDVAIHRPDFVNFELPGDLPLVEGDRPKPPLPIVARLADAELRCGCPAVPGWASDRRAELDAGRLCAVVAALRTHVETTPEARKCIHYVFGNHRRMRYPRFPARGLCISSGVVEAGCKQTGDRLKRAGMRCTVAGANASIALQCCILSRRFEDFWERRAANAA